MRIIFAGTPETALPSLRALVEQGHEIVAVLTRPDAPAGRGKKLTASPVASLSDQLGLPVLKPAKADDELVAQVRALDADVAAVVAFGMLLPQALLDAVPGGWINLHFSLLPRWRGAAPVQRAIWAGDAVSGVTAFRITKPLDAGPVYRTLEVPVEPGESSGALLARLAELGAPVLAGAIADAGAGIQPVPQPTSGITTAAKIRPADAQIDWTRPAAEIDRLVRAVSPDPGAWTLLHGERFKVFTATPAQRAEPRLAPGELAADRRHLWVGTGDGDMQLIQVAAAGRKPMAGADWARGQHDGVSGVRFDG